MNAHVKVQFTCDHCASRIESLCPISDKGKISIVPPFDWQWRDGHGYGTEKPSATIICDKCSNEEDD